MPLADSQPATDLEQARAAADQGRYQDALLLLDAIEGSGPAGSVSAACALRGSILRQVHQHRLAEEADRRALAHAVGDPASDTRIDALAGLVADAIGNPTQARERWLELQPRLASASLRSRVPACWVGAKVHLALDQPARALPLARASVEGAEQLSPGHQAKSLLVLGVCQQAADDPAGIPAGIPAVHQAAVRAAAHRLRPLLWPSAYLLACWLPEPASQRWWRWSQQVVAAIEADLPGDLLAGWRADPAVAALSAQDAAPRSLG